MNAVLNYIQHKLGEPAELRTLLKTHPGFAATLEQPPRSIAVSSVVKWLFAFKGVEKSGRLEKVSGLVRPYQINPLLNGRIASIA